MSTLVAEARSLRRQLSDNVLNAKEHEDNLRAARLRVGHAADELGQDESRVARRMMEARTAVEGAHRRLSELGMPLESGIRELTQSRRPQAGITRQTADLLRQLGGQAILWLETEAQLGALGARVVASEREREDLHFQIAQLKGRLGILNAEADSQLNLLRSEAETLEAALTHVLEALARASDPVTRILAEIPSIRDTVTNTRTSGKGRNAALGG
jgi:chromosome segregation ATPase